MKRDEDERNGRKPENEQADDVATLYSWANLHGAKYRDFSASRQEARAQLRQRTMDDRARLARDEARGDAPRPEDENDLWETLLPGVKLTRSEPARPESPPERPERVGERLGERASERMAERTPEWLGERPTSRASERPGERASERTGDRPSDRPGERPIDKALERLGRVVEATMPQPQAPPVKETETPAVRTLPPAREEEIAKERAVDRLGSELENARYAEAESAPMRPAWLGEAEPAVTHAAEPETLPPARERVGSRWFALRGLYGRSPEEAQPKRQEGPVPVLAVFSLAGGVGKTSLVASVGRALSARGEHVLLADTSLFGVLPFYFGAREIKPDVLRTFSGGPSDTPVQLLTLDGERAAADQELLKREVARAAQDANRVLIDVATGSAAMLRQALRLSPTVLVPVVPDMASAVSLQSLETFFRNQEGLSGHPLRAWYVLNQFDPSMPLQLDVREVLRQQLGERLLPFAIHRSTAVSEALAEGMTVIDYAPNSPAAEDIMNLVTWIRNTSAAVTTSQRGMRWSER
ncbi:MAG TPA: cellulose biosynthesis protein BcsQ [Acidobacteriaceae bacterium]|jgi:cellulose synthase operon protein YhjQ|nr:cellulose biosynthesis protein BcsQ [Acidobacteriaceae bacterium]